MHDAVLIALRRYQSLERMYPAIYSDLSRLETLAKSSDLTQGDRADAAYAMREISRVVADIRKEADRIKRLLDQVMCVVWTTNCETDDSTPRSIHGEVAIATPNVKMGVTLPTKNTDPENYRTLMQHFGFSDELIEADAVRTHWPGMVQYMTNLMEEGKPLPPGVRPDQTYPIYNTTIRKRPEKEVASA